MVTRTESLIPMKENFTQTREFFRKLVYTNWTRRDTLTPVALEILVRREFGLGSYIATHIDYDELLQSIRESDSPSAWVCRYAV